jgi:hypothetical protein
MGNCEFVNAEYKRQGGAHMENDHAGQEIGTGKHGRCANTAWRQLQMESSAYRCIGMHGPGQQRRVSASPAGIA